MSSSNAGDRDQGAGAHLLLYAPEPTIAGWIREELADQRVTIRSADTLRDVISTLVEQPPPRPQIMVADFDDMTPPDVLQLHRVRHEGWFGVIIAIGTIDDDLKVSLNISCALVPFKPGALKKAIGDVGLSRATTKMGKLERPK